MLKGDVPVKLCSRRLSYDGALLGRMLKRSEEGKTGKARRYESVEKTIVEGACGRETMR